MKLQMDMVWGVRFTYLNVQSRGGEDHFFNIDSVNHSSEFFMRPAEYTMLSIEEVTAAASSQISLEGYLGKREM